jgi:hypothetical protein
MTVIAFTMPNDTLERPGLDGNYALRAQNNPGAPHFVSRPLQALVRRADARGANVTFMRQA